ncbi:MarR family winged helix-turn-helix transcriptional regulator [Arenibaculum sp.]|jgi:DNA-binding MarR family transcriptional regulator|uniref:MarR family winged helix-turn-helix transcriptional regulator n=1 Tax=Arenibaculum sp. TaxID=2865862 RepID=UPI002E0DDC4D|nr:MarR family transcriptional regulator [Arenibaculum sp.]
MAQKLEALDLWRTVLVTSVRRAGPDLSSRQLALLLTVYLTPSPHTVRGLAATLNVSKPAISRALDRLGRLGFLRRKRDEADRRNVLVQRTVKGSVFLTEFAQLVMDARNGLRPSDLPVAPVPMVEGVPGDERASGPAGHAVPA